MNQNILFILLNLVSVITSLIPSIDCLYHTTTHLSVSAKPCVIKAGTREEINFSFFPRHIKKYHEVVTFLVNGLSRVEIHIHGQGTELKVQIQF